MDLSQEVKAPLTFAESCLLAFRESPVHGRAPIVGIDEGISYVQATHTLLGVPFNREEYWNPSVIRGYAGVFSDEVTQAAGVALALTEESSVEDISRVIQIIAEDGESFSRYRQALDQANRNNPAQSTSSRNRALMSSRNLDLMINQAPIHVFESVESDEDDFL